MKPGELREGLKSVCFALTTPYFDNEEIDYDGLKSNVKFYLKTALKKDTRVSFMVGGTVGEFYNLNDNESRRIIETVVDAVDGKAPVIAGTGRPSTKQTVELSKYAVETGASGVVVVLPYYVTPNEDGIYYHMKAVCDSVDTGVVLYDNTDSTKIQLPPALIRKMADDFDNFIGIKENSTDALFWYNLKSLQGRLTIYPGKGEIPYASFLTMGVPGFATTIGNFAPEIAFDVFNAGEKKNYDGVWKALSRLNPYRAFLGRVAAKRKSVSALGQRFTTNFTYYAVIRSAAEIRGLKEGNLRAPLATITAEEKAELADIMKEMGVI